MGISDNGQDQSTATSVAPDTVGSPQVINADLLPEDFADIGKGFIFVGDGSAEINTLAPGADTYHLVADSGEALGIKWEAMPTSFPPSGAAGGDLSGTYPNPSVVDDGHNHTLSTITDSGTMAAESAADYVEIAGDTMTGFLTLSGAPTADLHAATKKYVDDEFGSLTAADVANVPAGGIAATDVQAAINELDQEKLDKAGGTMTGGLLMAAGAGIISTGASANESILEGKITGDLFDRFRINADGDHIWDTNSDGSPNIEANPGGGVLTFTTGKVAQSAAPTAGTDLTNKTYVDGEITNHTHVLADITDAGTAAASAATDFVAVTGDSMTGNLSMDSGSDIEFSNNSQLLVLDSISASTDWVRLRTSGDSQDRFKQRIDGRMFWGSGSATVDVNLEREGAGVLSLGGNASAVGLDFSRAGDSDPRFRVLDSSIEFGSGSATPDVVISRVGVDTIQLGSGDQIRVQQDPVNDNDLARKKYVDDLVSANVFGDEYQQESEAAQLDTTSGTYAQFMRLTTPSIPAGTYRIGWRFSHQGTLLATQGQYRIQIDDTTTVEESNLDTHEDDELHHFSNFKNVVLTAGVHTIDIDANKLSGGGTFTIDDGEIEIWRVA